MINQIRATAIVLLCMYLPCAFLWAQGFRKPEYLPVIPGWWLAIPLHGNKEFQYWFAAIGTLGVLVGLSWLGTKGRSHLFAAAVLAFLNSAVVVALTSIAIGVAAAGAGTGH